MAPNVRWYIVYVQCELGQLEHIHISTNRRKVCCARNSIRRRVPLDGNGEVGHSKIHPYSLNNKHVSTAPMSPVDFVLTWQVPWMIPYTHTPAQVWCQRGKCEFASEQNRSNKFKWIFFSFASLAIGSWGNVTCSFDSLIRRCQSSVTLNTRIVIVPCGVIRGQ